MSKLFSRRTVTISAFGVITMALGLSIGRDIRQYIDGSTTPQGPIAAPSTATFPSTNAQEVPMHQSSSIDTSSLQEQRNVLQRERDDLARKISQLEQRIAANKN